VTGLTRAQRDELVTLINGSNIGQAEPVETLYRSQSAFDLVDAVTGTTVRWRGEDHTPDPFVDEPVSPIGDTPDDDEPIMERQGPPRGMWAPDDAGDR
jgi:hypothetical protein